VNKEERSLTRSDTYRTFANTTTGYCCSCVNVWWEPGRVGECFEETSRSRREGSTRISVEKYLNDKYLHMSCPIRSKATGACEAKISRLFGKSIRGTLASAWGTPQKHVMHCKYIYEDAQKNTFALSTCPGARSLSPFLSPRSTCRNESKER